MQIGSVSPDQAASQAVASYRSGDPKSARRLCEQVLSREPGHGAARHLLGVIALDSGDLAAGLGHLELLCAQQQPAHPAYRAGLARAYLLSGERELAAAEVDRALEGAPSDPELLLDLAGLLATLERREPALELLRRARRLAPRHPGILVNLGNLLAVEGSFDDAIGCLETALALEPHSAAINYNLAKALRARGRPKSALEHYRRATTLDPGLVSAHHNLGNLLLDLRRVEEAAEAFEAAVQARRRLGAPDRGLATFRETNAGKLRHDVEQLGYLEARGLLAPELTAAPGEYREALAEVEATAPEAPRLALPGAGRPALAHSYNRLIHRRPAPALDGPAVSPALERAAIEADYAANAPGITFADDFLTAPALAALRRFCLESTVWFNHRYANGYLGAFMDEGFCCPLLLQIAEELRAALPGIFRDTSLRKLWAFKYDSRLSGIPIHADFAAVNVNFWITPDSANLDPEGGGLVVWDREAPLDWDFEHYNADEARIRGFLAESGAKARNVPHRQNRVVIFNSDLFHETGRLTFRDGYENRRINITMLYGKRGD